MMGRRMVHRRAELPLTRTGRKQKRLYFLRRDRLRQPQRPKRLLLTKTKPNEPPTWKVVSLADNPTSVILDLGCTRAMGSRQAIERFMKAAAKHHLGCEILPSQVTFSFANSETTQVTEKCIVWFLTNHPVPLISTSSSRVRCQR